MRVRRRRHMALHRGPAPRPAGPTERWAMDFVHDALADGRPFRILTVVYQGSRQSPLLEVAARMSGQMAAKPSTASARASRVRAQSRSITARSFSRGTSRTGAYHRGVQLDFIRPGEPVENAFIEPSTGVSAMSV